MSISVESVVMFFAWVSLILATSKAVPEFRFWSWGWGGLLLYVTAQFVHFN